MLSLSCAQIPRCEHKLELKQQLTCNAFIIYVNAMNVVYVPINNEKSNVRKAKKTGYEVVEVSWNQIESTALGLTLLIANGNFPREILPFVFLPNNIEYIDEKTLIKEWRENND